MARRAGYAPAQRSATMPAMYEAKTQPLLARAAFARRLALHAALALALVVLSLGAGMAGYMLTERMSALDAFVNAAMLLGGMGPVNPLQTDAGKLFAGLYALYAGLVFLAVAGLLLAPFAHRLLHRFHWDSDQG